MERKKQVELSPDLKTFFRQYLEVLSPLHNITSREADVLAQLLYYNYLYQNYDEKLRSKILFDYDTKKEIEKELKMSAHQFLNILKALRKKQVVINNTINKDYQVFPEDEDFQIVYKFNIQDDPKMHQR